jgi:transposase
VGNPLKLKAISAGKKKNDRLDAETLCDLLRANVFPECYMASTELRNLRRVLRYRHSLVGMETGIKNRSAAFLMECGAEYEKTKLHQKKYFHGLLGNLDEVPDSVIEMLSFNRELIEMFEKLQRYLMKKLKNDPLLKNRVELLMTIPVIGEVMGLTWALETGTPHRFKAVRKAVSYCGLCCSQRCSAEKSKRTPISKQRNRYLQWALIEVAKLAPRYNERLAEIYDKELKHGNRNSATLKVARTLVSWLLAVDKSGKPFEERPRILPPKTSSKNTTTTLCKTS